MNRDFDFYGKIIKQEHPNDLNTIVNKYYQLDENYEPNDLVDINTNAGTYGNLIVSIPQEKLFMMIFKL